MEEHTVVVEEELILPLEVEDKVLLSLPIFQVQ